MHGEHGYAHINGVDVHVCNELCNRSAAAEIHSSEFARLPNDVLFCENSAQISDVFRTCVVAAGLAACARKFVHSHAAVDKACVHFFKSGCVSRIVACGDVRRDALGMFAEHGRIYAVTLCDFVEKVVDKHALHAGVTFAADLFFVGKDAKHGLVGFGLKSCGDFGISAHSVVVAVTCNERSVKSDVFCFDCRHCFEFCGDKVFLGDAVLCVENGKHTSLHRVFVIVFDGDAAHEKIEIFRGETFRNGLRDLFLRKVRKKVCDVEHGVGLFFAHSDGDFASVFECDYAVKRKRNGEPLILLDAAVIVRLEICKTCLFKKRNLF